MHTRRRIISLFLIIAFLLNIFLIIPYSEAAEISGNKPQTSGKAVVLMDANSGRVLYEKNSHKRLSQASLTKIMTGFLAAENAHLNKNVKVSEYAANTPECSIYLEPGEILTQEELLYAAMLNSANDAATALAESVSGSEKDFVKLMNKRAAQLGMKDTHYTNPHGLEAEGHYSSAYDLALLSKKALSNQVFAETVKTKYKKIPWAGHDEERVLINMNRLLYRYDNAIGIKTGYTKEAGNCVVGAARKGDMTLIAVSMNSPAVYDDLQKMLDYGFENYQMVALNKSQPISVNVKVVHGTSSTVVIQSADSLMIAATAEEIPYLTYSIVPPLQVEAPIKEGSALGSCKVYINGKQITAIDLLATKSVAEEIHPNYIASLGQSLLLIFTRWYLYLIGIVLALLIYKRKNNLSFEQLLKRFLQFLLKRQINKRSKEMK